MYIEVPKLLQYMYYALHMKITVVQKAYGHQAGHQEREREREREREKVATMLVPL